nr:hypothetical protein [Acetobacter malorum]
MQAMQKRVVCVFQKIVKPIRQKKCSSEKTYFPLAYDMDMPLLVAEMPAEQGCSCCS